MVKHKRWIFHLTLLRQLLDVNVIYVSIYHVGEKEVKDER